MKDKLYPMIHKVKEIRDRHYAVKSFPWVRTAIKAPGHGEPTVVGWKVQSKEKYGLYCDCVSKDDASFLLHAGDDMEYLLNDPLVEELVGKILYQPYDAVTGDRDRLLGELVDLARKVEASRP